MQISPGQQRFFEILGLGLLIIFGLIVFVWGPSREALSDFVVYRLAAADIVSGENPYIAPYNVALGDGRTAELPYLYSPLLALSVIPLLGLDMGMAKLLWTAGNFLALILTALAFAKLAKESVQLSFRRCFSLAFALLITFEPAYWSELNGQVNLVLLALLAWWFYLQGRGEPGARFLGGVALALAAWLKSSPAILVLIPLGLRDYRALSGVICGSVMVIGAILFSVGYEVLAQFLRSLPALLGGEALLRFSDNISLERVLSRILGDSLPPAVILTLRVTAIALASYFLFLLPFRRPATSPRLIAGIGILLMVALSPVVWPHHFVFLAIPFAALIVRRRASTEVAIKHSALLIGFIFLTSQSNLTIVKTRQFFPEFVPLAQLLPYVFMLTLAILLIREIRLERSVAS